MSSTLATALAFASHNIPVFPLWWPTEHRGKRICACWKGGGCGSQARHPIAALNGHTLARNGHLDGTVEEGIIKLSFGTIAPGANLGIWTRELIVLDVDPRH